MLAVLFAGCSRFSKSHHARIRVLIVDGFSNHDWQRTTLLLRGILESAGEFDVRGKHRAEETGSAAWAAWRPRFADYDVVIQTCNENADNGLLHGVAETGLAGGGEAGLR